MQRWLCTYGQTRRKGETEMHVTHTYTHTHTHTHIFVLVPITYTVYTRYLATWPVYNGHSVSRSYCHNNMLLICSVTAACCLPYNVDLYWQQQTHLTLQVSFSSQASNLLLTHLLATFKRQFVLKQKYINCTHLLYWINIPHTLQ